jgi:DNA-binding PadR family transcriptional regulator
MTGRGPGRHGHHGGPPFGGPGGGRGFGGPPFGGPGGFGGPGRRRRMRRGDVRAAMLVLLDEQSLNGYGLMQEIEQRSGGAWRPSPGSVYPALSQLEDEGLVKAEEADGRKQYALTDEGRTYVDENRERLGEPWADAGQQVGEERLELRGLLWQLGAAAMQVGSAGTDAQVAQARQILVDARKAIYRLLAEDEDTDGEPDDTPPAAA